MSVDANEQARLDALSRLAILDTACEERFDRITRLASYVMGTPIALVSLVDANRQWFKSRVGLDASQTPRVDAFCHHAINAPNGELFVVPDTHDDHRFAENRLVVEEPNIRFYAGRVVRAPTGEAMGTLCVIDQRPRILDDTARQALDDLGAMVEQEFARSRLYNATIVADRSRPSEHRVLSALSEGLLLYGLDGHIVEWNTAAESILGLAHPQIAGQPAQDPLLQAFRPGGENLPPEEHPALQALTIGKAVRGVLMGIRRTDGTSTWLRVSAQPTFDELGRLEGALATFEDVTSKIELEGSLASTLAAVEQAETATHTLARHLSIGIYRCSVDGNVTYANAAWYEVFGIADIGEPVETQVWVEAVHPADRDRLLEDIAASSRRRTAFESTFRARPREGAGQERWIRATASAILNRDASLTGFVGSVEDITDRRRDEERLASFSAKLARSNSELAEFASVAAHDLAEPLRVIEGYLHVLRARNTDKLDAESQRYIDHAVEGAERLQHLINDLLSYSRTTSELLQPIEIDLSALVPEVLKGLAVSIAETDAQIEIGSLCHVRGSRREFEQLFQNLVSNSLKFGKAGISPVISITTREVTGGWEIDVVDNGIGIPTEHRERIFGMFKRLNGRDEYPGTGMGLAICRKVVEAHNGQISVLDSAQGTHIRIVLPIFQQTVGKPDDLE